MTLLGQENEHEDDFHAYSIFHHPEEKVINHEKKFTLGSGRMLVLQVLNQLSNVCEEEEEKNNTHTETPLSLCKK